MTPEELNKRIKDSIQELKNGFTEDGYYSDQDSIHDVNVIRSLIREVVLDVVGNCPCMSCLNEEAEGAPKDELCEYYNLWCEQRQRLEEMLKN